MHKHGLVPFCTVKTTGALLSAGLANTVLGVTSLGITCVVTCIKQGVQLPVVPGPKLGFWQPGTSAYRRRGHANLLMERDNANSQSEKYQACKDSNTTHFMRLGQFAGG
ncbi:hypothetical protein J3458_009228 [Metarhizium acridum]|uniref:uncharacterized protein n=1 Tax=Metarhizium acridum TaxID=92637 RepID=UPI001C6CC876|nr:hypothetical protein J3458_009228 [Metarhizium acridum]